jgi:hypothetical protein
VDWISTTGVELNRGSKLVWQEDDHDATQLRQRKERFSPGDVADAPYSLLAFIRKGARFRPRL